MRASKQGRLERRFTRRRSHNAEDSLFRNSLRQALHKKHLCKVTMQYRARCTSRWCGCASISAYSGMTASVAAVNTLSADSGRPAACTGAPVKAQELHDSLLFALVAHTATARKRESHVHVWFAGAANWLV